MIFIRLYTYKTQGNRQINNVIYALPDKFIMTHCTNDHKLTEFYTILVLIIWIQQIFPHHHHHIYIYILSRRLIRPPKSKITGSTADNTHINAVYP